MSKTEQPSVLDIGDIEMRLRRLAAKFTGVEMGHRLPPSDHGSARSLGVTFVNDRGEDVDVGDELLEIADRVAMLDPITIRRPSVP